MRRLLLVPILLVAACGDETAPTETAAEPPVPASYSYDLESSCGERNLIGTFHVSVEGDQVIRAEATGRTTVEPDLAYVPSLDDLEEMVEEAEPDAVVETERDADGRLTWVSIDHLPDAIDDEECYRISNIREEQADGTDQPVVSCGGGGPGWPISAMDGGIEPSTPRADIEAALEETEQEMGIDGPFRGEREWIVLAEDDDGLTLGTGHWDADGPGEDAMVVTYASTGDGLDWTGHGDCRLAPVLPAGEDWAEVTAPPDGLDRTAPDLTVLVNERQCTSGRDPRPHLDEPSIIEQDDLVVVSWTSPQPRGAQNCVGNPSVEQVIHLDEPLGDRQLLDGSTWPAGPVE
jgi:hypothetical protein